jgi:hypothetical protein
MEDRNHPDPISARSLLVGNSGRIALSAFVFLFLFLANVSIASAAVHYRINAGGGALDGNGDSDTTDPEDWLADFSSPSAYFSGPGLGIAPASATSIHVSVPSSTPSAIFNNQRSNLLGFTGSFSVTADKVVDVNFYFTDGAPYISDEGQRKFKVTIDGVSVLREFDVVGTAGMNVGYMVGFRIVSDGSIDLEFGVDPFNPTLNGLEIVDAPAAASALAVWPSSPRSLDFGDVEDGTSLNKLIRVANRGAGGNPAISLNSATITGPDAARFSTNFSPSSLAANTATSFQVTYTPNAKTFHQASLVLGYGSSSTVTIPLRGYGQAEDAPAFNQLTLRDSVGGIYHLDRPTSLQWGPDGRLYVALESGYIKALTVIDNGTQYRVLATETISVIRNIQNHHEVTGAYLPGITDRLLLGILVVGTSGDPVIYASSTDPRAAACADPLPACQNSWPDSNSGVISKITRQSGVWVREDLVRGLPRARYHHALGGLQLDESTDTLYVTVGGHTNKGGPSVSLNNLPEFAYSGAVIAIDLDGLGTPLPYDMPTLNDDSRAGNPDANDPFGSNSGKNQAKVDVAGPVQLYATGFRNPFDLLLKDGKIYLSDNGPNDGYGNVPLSCGNGNAAGGTMHLDNMHVLEGPGFYGGHPNPARGNTSIVWNSDNIAPVPAATPAECNYLAPGDDGGLAFFFGSTNGIAEYTAGSFDGAMVGDLLLLTMGGAFKGLTRLRLDADGDEVVARELLFENLGTGPLDLAVVPDGESFAGTVWVADYVYPDASPGDDSTILVLEPTVLPPCTPTESDAQDSDGDGYTDFDEWTNGTDRCNPAVIPPDHDGDFRSDLLDDDDDNDTLLDNADKLALDEDNGSTGALPFTLDFGGPAPGTIRFTGFTGVMVDGDDYLDNIDATSISVGDAAGRMVLSNVPAGEASASPSSQRNGLQIGLPGNSGLFTVHTRLATPFSGLTTVTDQRLGLYVGTGDQDNYVRIEFKGVGSNQTGIVVNGEVAGSFTTHQGPVASSGTLPSLVDLYLTVDTVAKTVTPAYRKTGGSLTVLAAVNAPTGWFGSPLALGLTSSRGTGTAFAASWDFFKAYAGGPASTPPTANADAATVGRSLGVLVNVLANDTDDDGSLDPTTVSVVSGPANGSTAVHPTTGVITYTHNGSNTNSDSFTYKVKDNTGVDSNTATVSITVAKLDTLHRVNAGGPALSGKWGEDRAWVAGVPSSRSNHVETEDHTWGTASTITLDGSVPAGTPMELFQDERFDVAGTPPMIWSFPANPGQMVEARLYFSENFLNTGNTRKFNVSAEGNACTGLQNFDVWTAAGGQFKGIMRTCRAYVGVDGDLDLQFDTVAVGPIVMGIEILGQSLVDSPPDTAPVSLLVAQGFQIRHAMVPHVTGATPDPATFTIVNEPTHGDAEIDSSGQLIYINYNDGATSDRFSYTVKSTAGVLSNTAEVTIAIRPRVLLYRINAGGPALTQLGGNWAVDTTLLPSTYVNHAAIGNTVYSTTATITADSTVPSGTNLDIFKNERFDVVASPNMIWSLPVTAGTQVEVFLYFAEIYYNGANQRKFNVSLEGGSWLTNFDIYATTGAMNKGTMKDKRVFVDDGTLNIELSPGSASGAKVDGIEVWGPTPP